MVETIRRIHCFTDNRLFTGGGVSYSHADTFIPCGYFRRRRLLFRSNASAVRLRLPLKFTQLARVLCALFRNSLGEDHILHLSKTLVQISTNGSKMTLFGRRVVTINLVERWLIHPNPGPVMSPLCQFSHPF